MHQPPWSFGFDSKREEPGQTGRHPVLKYRVPQGSQPRPGWAPDPLMVGIRSPDGLVVGSCTSHPGVLRSIPNERNQGKQGPPCVKVPGCVCVLLLQDLLQSCARGGRRRVEDMCYERRRVPHGSHIKGTAVINTHTYKNNQRGSRLGYTFARQNSIFFFCKTRSTSPPRDQL